MKVFLKAIENGELVEAIITKAEKGDMPLRKDGWQFTWKKLFSTDGALFYKLAKVATPEEVEGILMLTLINEEMLYMNNLEVAPHNYGSTGKYDNVAGCLIAFACYKSFELGKNHYLGFLTFESKTQLIELYERKYGATFAMGQKMFFDPGAGKKLMKKFLLIEFNKQ
ncbi:MAG: hypothetical protein JNK77_17265 [Saprospiraceae bacterium]|nr:hypothetical protein [Saprospiraceae bacterium]